jgi:outer membrane protein assembly factor BamD
VIVSEYKLAEQSILTKQLDRYKEVVEHFKVFVDKYPDSEYLSDAEKLYASSLEVINKWKINNS